MKSLPNPCLTPRLVVPSCRRPERDSAQLGLLDVGARVRVLETRLTEEGSTPRVRTRLGWTSLRGGNGAIFLEPTTAPASKQFSWDGGTSEDDEASAAGPSSSVARSLSLSA